MQDCCKIAGVPRWKPRRQMAQSQYCRRNPVLTGSHSEQDLVAKQKSIQKRIERCDHRCTQITKSWKNLVKTQKYSGQVCLRVSLTDIVQPGAHKSGVSCRFVCNPATAYLVTRCLCVCPNDLLSKSFLKPLLTMIFSMYIYSSFFRRKYRRHTIIMKR